MKVLVKYTGNRAEKLDAYKDKDFRSGPYDFTSGQALMDEQDAEVIVTLNPLSFFKVGTPIEDEEVDVKKEKKAEVTKPGAKA
jgi:hypothetical protein